MAEITSDFDWQRTWNSLWLFRRRLVIAVVLGVVSVLLLLFGAYRLWQMIRVVQSDLRREQTGLQRTQQRATLITSITPETRNDYELVGRALPLYKDPLVVLRTVEAVARTTEVSLSEYEFSPGVVSTDSASLATTVRSRDGGADTLDLKFEMSGSFQAVTNAVEALESSLPLIEVIDITVNPSRSGAASNDGLPSEYTAVLQIQAYYAQVDPKSAAQQGAAKLSASQEETLARVRQMTYRAGEAAAPVGGSATTPAGGNNDLFGIQSGIGDEP